MTETYHPSREFLATVNELKRLRSPIWEAIQRERAYQDRKYGTPAERDLSVGMYLHLASVEFGEAIYAESDEDALRESLQACAVIVAMMERHGVVEREHGR